MSEIKLKPCPFCGGEAYFRKPQKEKGGAFVSVGVECKKCGAYPYSTLCYEFLSESELQEAAAKSWNRRAGEQDEVKRK